MQAAATLGQSSAPEASLNPEHLQRIGGDVHETKRDLLNLLFFAWTKLRRGILLLLHDQPDQKRGGAARHV